MSILEEMFSEREWKALTGQSERNKSTGEAFHPEDEERDEKEYKTKKNIKKILHE